MILCKEIIKPSLDGYRQVNVISYEPIQDGVVRGVFTEDEIRATLKPHLKPEVVNAIIETLFEVEHS